MACSVADASPTASALLRDGWAARHAFVRFYLLVAMIPVMVSRSLLFVDATAGTAECSTRASNDGACVVDQDTATVAGSDEKQQRDVQDFAVVGSTGVFSVGYGDPQIIEGDDAELTRKRVADMLEYMKNLEDRGEISLVDSCLNRNELCAYWATIGECDANPNYMQIQCAPACLSCDQLIFENRCPLPDNQVDIWQPGTLSEMFERIVNEPYYQDLYSPTILARPGQRNAKTGDSPWIVVLENVLTDEECQMLIELGANQGYERSADVGAMKFDGTYDSDQNNGRTSENAWCVDACYDHPITKQVIKKLENITGIPDSHSEYLQLLRYEPNQFYNDHHDYIPHHINRAQGVRILTLFLYLSDVEEGGETHFTNLGIKVEPKRGRALLWPSVRNNDPNKKDARTHHEAMPVIKGVKYAANAWYHQHDFKTPYASNCI